ncbi:MAG: histidinol-phosphatase [Lachnospiraceae bacterium]|nr:histidinol-phosphatase [Lachnospiraceae bacterium]
MKTNFHTHCKRCLHAQGTEEDYVQAAIAAGLDQLGFSDHAPFPDADYGLRMPYTELTEYLHEITHMQEKYRSEIVLWKGLEIEYLPEAYSYYEDLLTNRGMDYLLMGEHFYRHDNGRMQNITQAENTDEYVIYAHNIAKGLKTGFFNAVVHPDIFMITQHAWDINCDRATDIILNAAIMHDTVLEYNANGYRRGITDYPDGSRYQYPHHKFWEQAAKAKVRVMVGSDCHNPSQVWDSAMDQAYQDLSGYGITPITDLLNQTAS